MEIALLIVIFFFLIIRFNTILEKLDALQYHLTELQATVANMKLKTLPKENTENVVEFEKNEEIIPEAAIETPSPIPIKIIPEATTESLKKEIFVPEPVVYEEPKPSWWETFREQNPDLEKFIGENLISKLGVLILVLGISYFVKYAIDKNWINETARVGIGILCGAIVMGFAHRLRANYKAFSSVLVAGAIAIFYFTIAIAFHQYHIFGQTVAFVLMVIVTAFSVLISVSYDRMELAILSLIGGFSVPFMISTGSGNYQVLFTYIAILDIGILAIAYHKKWSLVNVLAFAFTSLLYAGWLFTKVIEQPNAPYGGAAVFATIFYVIFSFVNIINNIRTQGVFSKIELSVLLANTAFYFTIGIVILSHYRPEFKGLFTISLALFNFLCAWVLYKKFGLDKKAVYLLIGLTLTFVTLAIPIQFKGNHITLFWAAEAVLLLWLAQRSAILQFRFASAMVQLLMLASLVLDWQHLYTSNDAAPILLNSSFIAGAFAVISLLGVDYLLQKEQENQEIYGVTFNPAGYRKVVNIAAIVVFYLTGLLETIYQSNQHFDSFYSAAAWPAAYHLVFGAILVFFLQKWQYRQLAIVLSLFNSLLFCIYFIILPFEELKQNLQNTDIYNAAFVLHYVQLACVVYFCWVVWRDSQLFKSLPLVGRRWFIWVASLAVVYMVSQEVMLIGLAYLTEPISSKSENTTFLADEMYQNTRTLLIKVAFPLLWGALAFLFLTIGIKNQWRNLRIVALTLLGLTIAKLFLYDISNVSETGKIIAFILLGVMILIMSFAYQKIKTIVLKDDEIQNENS